ncbi:hypothetical protein [Actinoplanes sp. NPDC051494]|uniref:hypothetical protein n=1 Tax=Actinoplanes sp. NPDC051494 TaxID=3363907 RepID=UPI00378CE7A3
MGERALRRKCEGILDDLDAGGHLDIRELCDLVSRRQGRPIHLVAESLPESGPCGLTVRTAAFDAIFYEKDTSPLHQNHIIGHELGHLVCGHLCGPVVDAEASRVLLPNLDPGLVRAVLGRTNYTAVEEREAEMIASLILRRTTMHVAPPTPADPAFSDVLDRLAHTLENPERRDRG